MMQAACMVHLYEYGSYIHTCTVVKSVTGSCSLTHDHRLMKGLIAGVIVG